MFPVNKVVILGAVSEFELDSENESFVTRSFCPKCGSQLFGRNSKMPGYLTISAGTLDDPNTVTPQAIVFVRTRRHWDTIDSALPAFETQPDWKPENESKDGES